MADIKKELNDIKNAVYGKEVRGSIHDGIKKINDEVENATDLSESAKHQVENIQQQVNQLVVEGDSSVEAAQARVDAEGKSYPTLKARLDAKETEFSSRLAHNTTFVADRTFNSQVAARGTNGAVVFIDDDLNSSAWRNHILPNLDQMVAPLTAAVPTDRIDGPYSLNSQEMKDAERKGVNFVSHSMSHVDLTTLTEEEIERELKGSRDRLRELGFTSYDTAIVYPHGNENETVRRIARKYFRSGIIDHLGINNTPPIDTYRLGRVYLNFKDGTLAVENVKTKMREARNGNQLLIVGMHASFNGFDVNALIEVMDYAKEIGLDTPTLDEALNRFGNLIEIGEGHNQIRVGLNGEGNLKDFLASNTLASQITIDTPLSFFNHGETVTRYYNNHPNVGGFPGGRSGFLWTLRLGNDWGCQLFRPGLSYNAYYRFWDYTIGDWTEFRSQTGTYIDRNNQANLKNGWTGNLQLNEVDGQVKHLRGRVFAGNNISRDTEIADIYITNSSHFAVIDAFNYTKRRKVSFYITEAGGLRILDNEYLSEGDDIRFSALYR